jgi:hypothetical protein
LFFAVFCCLWRFYCCLGLIQFLKMQSSYRTFMRNEAGTGGGGGAAAEWLLKTELIWDFSFTLLASVFGAGHVDNCVDDWTDVCRWQYWRFSGIKYLFHGQPERMKSKTGSRPNW